MTYLVHAGEGDLESHVKLVTPRSSESQGVCSDQAGVTTLTELYQGRRHLGGLALLDGHRGLLRVGLPGGGDIVRPHVTVDEAGADVVEGAGEDGESLAWLLTGESPPLAPADGEGVVGGRVTFVSNLDIFPGGRN